LYKLSMGRGRIFVVINWDTFQSLIGCKGYLW
jgi:hypothetical protein